MCYLEILDIIGTWFGSNCESIDLKKSVPDESLDIDRRWINQTLVHIVREWSESGTQERDQSFGLLLQQLIKIYPDESVRKNIRIFVPGSKLARLPFMIAAVSEPKILKVPAPSMHVKELMM